jgi:hypothetical protein
MWGNSHALQIPVEMTRQLGEGYITPYYLPKCRIPPEHYAKCRIKLIFKIC